jgi:histidine triad (HIT) family protein
MKEEKDCIFCKISSNEIQEKKIKETDNFLVIADKYPVSEGHCLIISKKHYENMLHLPSLLGTELVSLIKDLYISLSKEFGFQGFNLIQNNFKAAKQTINHFHVHLIPRRENSEVKLD